MCGFAGAFLANNKYNSLSDITEVMASEIHHRGPDDSGYWSNQDNTFSLSFKRLSIQDLSIAGRQPMQSSSNRYIICFNGEIYNHLELRKNINLHHSKKYLWNGHSDTETLLALVELFGIKKSLEMCKGMFALALWDNIENSLILARDRLGEKPLYYGWSQESFIFASELKALKKFPNFSNKINKESLVSFLRFNYVPGPESIYENIYKLEPGTFLKLSNTSLLSKNLISENFWSLEKVISNSRKNQFSSFDTTKHEIKSSLENAVKSQMISDVPLGVFLSGGIDSSLITAISQFQSNKPIQTFTVGFEDQNFDESKYAKQISDYLKTEHNELIVDEKQVIELIDEIPFIYDEPFADSSQLPTHLICKAAKTKVTVALSGDGGDEIFGGYNRYFLAPKIWSNLKYIPKPVRTSIGDAALNISQHSWNKFSKFSSIFPSMNIDNFGEKVHKLGHRLKSINSFDDLYMSLIAQWSAPENLVRDIDFMPKTKIDRLIQGESKYIESLDDVSKMMAIDSLTYLPDDILCKVDRAAMSISLETRAPFLDHELIECAWRVPHNLKVNSSSGKLILKNILYDYIPEKLFDRPKSGFGIPIGQWIKGPMRDWAESLINERRLEIEGNFHPQPIAKIWNEHISGQRDWTHQLWSILMFQLWFEQQ